MEAAKERSDLGLFFVVGAEIVENEWHKGEILVERRGLRRPKYFFWHDNKQFALLHWHRARLGTYEAKDFHLDLEITSMGRIITAKDKMSNLSHIKSKSLSPNNTKLSIQLANGDNFTLKHSTNNSGKYKFSLEVIKTHYIHHLAEFQFNLQKSLSHTIACIDVQPIMRWEAEHFHHLMALVMSRIAFLQEHNKIKEY
jgi:hypothetical protein